MPATLVGRKSDPAFPEDPVRALRVCVLVVLAAGCGRNKVTHGNIDHWITIEGGENKLKGAISGGYSAELRGHAVAALVQADLDGVNLADEALGKLPDSDQQAAMGEAVKRLMELGGGTQVGQTPQGKQIIAKDALFQLRKHASPADCDKIDVFLAAWVVADPPKRWETGRNTGDKILAELGPAASSELKRALAAGTPALKEVRRRSARSAHRRTATTRCRRSSRASRPRVARPATTCCSRSAAWAVPRRWTGCCRWSRTRIPRCASRPCR